ncbi:potassium voltage-gated channel subfamily A member 1-like isoform X6 [Bolinopsis microptera]|uniref:potassium voltage-gated channel subfamily A member 1-like isoform X6 n=1 Tax=Bolinopsis microptera TaxID=2820187 RepID=UPI00307AE39C
MILASSVYTTKRNRARKRTRFSLAMGEVYKGNYRYLHPDKSLSTKSPSNVVGAIQVPGSPVTAEKRHSFHGTRRPSTCTTIFEDAAWVDDDETQEAGLGEDSFEGLLNNIGARRMNANSNNRKKCGNNLTIGGRPDFDHKVPANSLDGLKDHNDHQSTWVNINVAGATFILKRDLLRQHPNTLLGSDNIKRYYRQDLSAYYFDRNREAFDAIVSYYLSDGQIPYLCDTLDEGLVTREFEYFKIPLTPREFEPVPSPAVEEIRDNTSLGQWKAKIDSLINVPESSRCASLYAIIDCFFILVSISFLVLETEGKVKDYFINPQNKYYYHLFGINAFIMAFFTADYMARLWSAQSKNAFLKQILPWMDLLSILPFYMELAIMAYHGPQEAAAGSAEQQGSGGWYVVLRVCRVFRVIRVFKLARRSENLLILLKAVGNTSTELFVLFVMVFMVVLMFGSIMYTVEKTTSVNGTTKFTSIMSGCWWSVITVTTVGYGDMYPETPLGMVLGTVALMLGLVLMALPVTIIVAKFSDEYERSKT